MSSIVLWFMGFAVAERIIRAGMIFVAGIYTTACVGAGLAILCTSFRDVLPKPLVQR